MVRPEQSESTAGGSMPKGGAQGATTTSPFKRDALRMRKVDYIRQVASDQFNRKGFDATSLDDVADIIGISKPSIYYYYKNKSELLLDCYTRTLDICEALADEAQARGGTALDKLCFFTRELIYLNCAHGSIAIVSEISSVPEAMVDALRKRNTALTEKLLKMTKDGVADGSMRANIGKPTIYFIMGGVNWIPRWHREDGSMTPDALADSYTEFLMHGVAAE
ncbi:TetR/AcrR family transcriptional regulator [Cognatishimia sp.]|uniref:TetR/AcrR family transcriptional regulator n=1 Tax=Cognatishimia sp. TaxID=2211648 RepID=UPI0035161FD6